MSKSILQSLLYCGFYAICSICFSLSAKNLFRTHSFQNIGILLLFESFVNVVICSIIHVIQIFCRSSKRVVKHKLEQEKVQLNIRQKPNYKEIMHKYLMTLMFSCLYLSNVLFGLKAFQFIPIPLFLTIRRTLIFFIYLVNIVFVAQSNSQITNQQKLSILLITLGAVVAGSDKMNTNMLGFTYCFLNNIFSACLLQLAKYLKDKSNMTPFQLVYNNSINTLPLLVIYCLITNDGQEFIQSLPIFPPSFYYHISLVAIFGFLLNFSTNLCAMKNSPFSIAITHNLKDIFSSVFSIIMFDDTIITFALVGGYIISLVGSIIYTLSKIESNNINESNKILYYQQSFMQSLNSMLNESKYKNSQKIYFQKSVEQCDEKDLELNLKKLNQIQEKSIIPLKTISKNNKQISKQD
ncbi:hypothetical protein ABPG72_021557 [Tetrahymena utriculariae]